MDALEQLSKLGKYGLLSIMGMLIALAAYGMYASTSVAEECAKLHGETNLVLRENVKALTELTAYIRLYK